MGKRPTSTILSVGNELTEGSILNTHFRFLGAELKGLGFDTVKALQIPDEASAFQRELREAIGSCDLVLITGGLGPTSDDLTREVIAEVCDAPLQFSESIWQRLLARYAGGGRKIAESNRKQAFIPDGFRVLANPVGTAPGVLGTCGSSLVAALPGPPAELEPMFLEEVVPLIQERVRGEVPWSELRCTAIMIPESLLEQSLLEGRESTSEILWSTRVALDRIVFTLRGGDEQQREKLFQALLDRFGALRIRKGDISPAALLYRTLEQRGGTVALAESCTGGLVSKMLTDVPGASEVFWGSLITYANAAKEKLLGVPPLLLEEHGAVSAEVARAMCAGLLERTPAGAVVSVTGVAGPDGGSEEKPVGTVYICARSRGGNELVKRFLFRGNREMIRRRSAVAALLLAECALSGIGADFEY